MFLIQYIDSLEMNNVANKTRLAEKRYRDKLKKT